MALIDAIDRGDYPAKQGEEVPDWFDEDDFEHLQHLHTRLKGIIDSAPGFMGRIVGGFCAVILNPKNNLIDMEDDCLSLHPRLDEAQRLLSWVEENRQELLAEFRAVSDEEEKEAA
ncbi:hypothetical protein [Uliginosibacterium sp. 31-12]|uniref:hypothetical protein n=1 Tax=Uliginosibacterium sp. 31-12 TaxID=3062781 RepID=UPI0026E21E0B|nr:hypothetical protein [Uliginosibacterium sp. 31-12]